MYLRIFQRVSMIGGKNLAFCGKIRGFCGQIRYKYDVFKAQGLIKKLAKHQHYLVKVDGHVRAWMKHLKVLTIKTSKPAHDSDKAWLLKGYDS